MKFDIDDKVILRFSDDRRASSTLFRAADGEFATVVERYSQPHLPSVDFYEVELETPVSIDGSDIVLISGLLSDELEKMEAQDEGKINPKYLTKNAKAMKDEIKKHAKKDSNDSSAYTSHPEGGWKADYDKGGKPYKTKVSQHTKRFHQMFGEAFMEQISEGQVDSALDKKAESTGISKTILRKVYNRGLAAWRTGHRPGVTQHQWAMARVNSFATKGKGTWGKADKDLAQKVRKTNEAIGYGANDEFVWEPSDERQIFTKKLKYINIDTYDEPKDFPPEVKAYFAKRYPDLERLTELGLTKGFVLESMRPEECIIKYWMGAEYGNYGIDFIEAVVLDIKIKFSLDIWDVDKDDNEEGWTELIERSDNRNFMMSDKMKYEMGKSFPFEAENIQITMNNSWDPNNWKYEVRFGE